MFFTNHNLFKIIFIYFNFILKPVFESRFTQHQPISSQDRIFKENFYFVNFVHKLHISYPVNSFTYHKGTILTLFIIIIISKMSFNESLIMCQVWKLSFPISFIQNLSLLHLSFEVNK